MNHSNQETPTHVERHIDEGNLMIHLAQLENENDLVKANVKIIAPLYDNFVNDKYSLWAISPLGHLTK